MCVKRVYRISWLSCAGGEHAFESDPYDAVSVAFANDGVIHTPDGREYTPDEMLRMLTEEDEIEKDMVTY